MGIDVFERVAHDPALLPDVSQVRNQLENGGMVVESLELFNSFFTLAVDEAIMVIVSIFDRLNIFGSECRLACYLGRGFLAVTDMLSRHLLGLLRWLDQPWGKRGYSNGFLVVARKGEHEPQTQRAVEHSE